MGGDWPWVNTCSGFASAGSGLDAQPCSTADDVVMGCEKCNDNAVPCDPGGNTDAVGNVRTVARQRDATTAGWLDYTSVQDVSLAGVVLMVRQGDVHLQRDETGIPQVRPAGSSVKCDSLATCGKPCRANQTTISSLLVTSLARHGWTPSACPQNVEPAGPREFLLDSRRPVSYCSFWRGSILSWPRALGQ